MLVVLVAVLVLVGTLPGLAAAQETRTGGTVVVAADEEVGELTAAGGTVLIEGTVDGDLTAFAGNVQIDGTVTGDVTAIGGNVWIAGDVSGDVSALSGNVLLEEGATIGGSLSAAAGTVQLAGEITGDADVGAGSTVVSSTAIVGGDLTYDGEISLDDEAQIGGTVAEGTGPTIGPTEPLPTIPAWVGALYWLLVNLVLGAILLLVAPQFSAGVADRVRTDPLPAGGVGLLTVVGVPIALVLTAITIVGIPLTILGVFLFALALWIGSIYGAFAVGTWLLAMADRPNRWGALALGLVLVALVGLIPFIGGLLVFVVLLLGLGGVVLSLYGRYQRRRERPTAPAGAGEPAQVP